MEKTPVTGAPWVGVILSASISRTKPMKLSAPTFILFLISVIVVVLAIIGNFVSIPFVTANKYWLAVGSQVILAIGCLLKGA
jgi:hypothetical protein